VVSIYEDLVEIDMTTGTAIRKQIYITPQDIAEGTYYRKHGSTMKSSMTGGSFWSDAGNSLLGALGAFKDGATFNIPAIVDRITGKKTGFGGQKGHGSVSKEQILEQLKR
jgi:hypothetical protein